MVTSALRLGLVVALLILPAWAQDNPDKIPAQASGQENKGQPKEAAAGADAPSKEERNVVRAGRDEMVKTLAPRDVPNELKRLKSKADIKAEITVQHLHGRASVFKGVIRNGKLIERFVGRRFVPESGIEQPRCGVRLWWVGGTDGWIFFRYSAIKAIALTGKLTAEERREIIRRLQAKKRGEEIERAKQEAEFLESQLEKMDPDELEGFLFRNYPEEKGWTHTRLRELKRKQIIENQQLNREEAIFVRYFQVLIKARLKELKRLSKKIELEPGNEDGDGDTESDEAPPSLPPNAGGG